MPDGTAAMLNRRLSGLAAKERWIRICESARIWELYQTHEKAGATQSATDVLTGDRAQAQISAVNAAWASAWVRAKQTK